MTDEYDRQRDIEAEGQRAAIFHAQQREQALPQRGQRRLLGITPDGRRVNNVTSENRWDVDEKQPWALAALLTEDGSRVQHIVEIPNTRERPDIVVHEEMVYIVVDTYKTPMQYRRCMVQRTTRKPQGST